MNPLNEADLNTCLKVLESSDKSAASGDRAEESRMLDVLKQLRNRSVTADLLKRTNAGKRLNKFCKHDSQPVSQAAKAAVEAWKQCVKQEQLQAEQAAGAAEGRQQHHSAEPAPAPLRSTVSASATPAGGQARPTSTGPPGSGAAELRRQPSAPKPWAGSLARSLSAGTPGGAFAINPPRCGNDTRDKVRVMLAEALAVGYGSAGAAPGDDCGAGGDGALQSPNLLAAAIEESLHELLGGAGQPGGDYKAKARSLCFNLKDAKNPDLRERVLSGSVPAEALVRMSAEELASDEQKKKNKELKDWLAKEATLGLNNTASTDMFQCGRCKQRKTTYYQLQTRSADEPMTTFVTCVNCQARWKFC